MHLLVRSTIRMSSASSFPKTAALITSKFLATTFSSSTTVFGQAESPLQVPDNAEILILRAGDIKSGSGLLRTPVGVYDGIWENAEMTRGRLKTAAGDVVKLLHDSTEIAYTNGGKFVGEVHQETLLPHGKGSFMVGCEERYTGLFQDGKYHGEGELVITKKGDKNSDNIDGCASLPNEEGTSIASTPICSTTYRGMFKAGRYHGNGKLTVYPKLIKETVYQYAGNFIEGEREGWMTVTARVTAIFSPHPAVHYERWEGGKCVEKIEF